jgi:GT2 family glycosyltransferase
VSSIGVVILHYRHWPSAKGTIEDVRAQTVPVELVVVDNASGDGCADQIRRAFPDVEVIEAPRNDGYAAGMNLGLARLAHCDAVLLCTHEVRLPPECIQHLRSRLLHRVAAVGPLLRNDRDGSVWSSGGYIDDRRHPVHHADVPTRPREVAWLDGACWLLRREAIDQAGPIDESFFLYMEEIDYASRLRKLGWTLVCAPEVVVTQAPGRMPPTLFGRNWLRWVRRQMGWRAWAQSSVGLVKQSMHALIVGRSPDRAFRLLAPVAADALRIPPRWLARSRTGSP